METIYIIILNYNNYKVTEECICSLRSAIERIRYNIKIILVDNNSTDGSDRQLVSAFGKDVVFVKNHKNEGYAAGNNIGIKYALLNKADYINILNNDTIITEDYITPCITYLNNHPNAGFISPCIEECDNNVVQSTGGDIDFKKGIVTVKNSGKSRKDLPNDIESDYIGGACLLFKADLIRKIGLMPEDYFLFFEETEWCWKAKKIGLKNICLTSTAIKHKGSATIDSIDGLHSYYMERNRSLFFKRNSISKLSYIQTMLQIVLRYIIKGIFIDNKYLIYLSYICDGICNETNNKYRYV